MRIVTYEDFDFSRSGFYRKTEPIDKNRVRQVEIEQKVDTIIDGMLETSKVAYPGDFIIRGTQNGCYVVGKESFYNLYEQDPLNANAYRHKNARRALFLEEDVIINTSWGGVQYIKAGGVVIDEGGSIHGVPAESFLNKNHRADNQGRPYISLKESLEKQYIESEKLGLEWHLWDIKKRMKFIKR